MATRVTRDSQRTATLFHALSDPTRLRVLAQLRHGERCVCDLMEATDAAQSRLSFHLRTLKEAGLLTDRREGRWVYYQINPDAIGELQQIVDDLVPAVPGNSSCGCD